MHKNAGRLNFSVVQLLVVIGVAAVVPPLLVGAYALYQLITSNHEQQKRELAATAQSLRLLVDRELETLRRKAELLGGARELLNGDPDVAKRLLDDGAMRTGHGFVLLDRTGGMIAKSDFDESPDQILSESISRVVHTGNPVVGHIAVADDGGPSAAVLIPLVANETVLRVLALVPNRNHFQKVVQTLNLREGWVAAIDDPRGVIVGRSERAHEFLGRTARLTSPHGTAGLLQFTDLQGRPSVFAYDGSPLSGFRAAVWVPTADFYAGSRTLTAWLTGIGALALVFSLAGAAGAALLIGGPVQQLMRSARSLQQKEPLLPQFTVMREVNAAEAAMSAASKAIALREQSLRRETERTTFLVKELAHRLKNLLAIIAAVVRQTSRTTVDFTLFVREFEGRLGAIARSVDLLVQSDWAGVPLRELLRHQLEAFSDISRFELSGPDLELTPKATEQLGIALHELTTNAVKHGALSREGGSVVIAWKIEADDFTFNWKELGGPRVTRPDRAGFGRTVVERVVPNALGGRSVLSFDPSGVEWHFRGPLTEALAGD